MTTTNPLLLVAAALVLSAIPLLAFWRIIRSHSDRIQLVLASFTICSLILVLLQLTENTKANLAATRGQLYATESSLARTESEDEGKVSLLSSIYVTIAPTYSKEKYQAVLMGLIGGTDAALQANTANALYAQLYGYEAFRDDRDKKNAQARKVFLHLQDAFYHVHNAFDYWRNGILSEGEWKTWKGYIREIGPHPVLLAVIWNGHRNRYFSQDFARFLQSELCQRVIPPDELDRDTTLSKEDGVSS
jgi:hypothetical protein